MIFARNNQNKKVERRKTDHISFPSATKVVSSTNKVKKKNFHPSPATTVPLLETWYKIKGDEERKTVHIDTTVRQEPSKPESKKVTHLNAIVLSSYWYWWKKAKNNLCWNFVEMKSTNSIFSRTPQTNNRKSYTDRDGNTRILLETRNKCTCFRSP